VARPRLLAVDLDGTLLDRQGQPHERDVRAIHAALAAGVRVSVVTGRLYSGTRPAVETLGLTGAVACADGSHLVRASDHSTLLHLGVRGESARLLRETLSEAGLTAFVFAEDAIGHDAEGAPFVGYVSTWSTDIRVTKDVFGHDLWSAQGGVTAAVAIGQQERVAAAVDRLTRTLARDVRVAMFPIRRGGHEGMWALLARAATGTKGTATRWIATYERVELEDTVCVGDWINDVPMFEVAGRSFAMGQAPDEVKAKATDVLDETSDEGGGVAHAIAESFGLLVK
jgi:hydroxymethylpyrimidine pyrophosphatase-like HAD family hydrolase